MARKKPHEEHENHERWLVSYADFITLLFAFFTVLYATSQKDIAKAKELEKSIKAAFVSFSDFGGRMGEHQDDGGKLIPPLIPAQGAGPVEVQSAIERLADKTISEEEQQGAGIEFRHDTEGVSVSLAASTLFGSGSAQLNEKAVPVLDKVARILKLTDRRLIVGGHTDDLPIKSQEFGSNWELSAARATKIVHYLIRRHKIDPKRVAVMAYADTKPISSNETESGRSKNRRIEILIITGDTNF